MNQDANLNDRIQVFENMLEADPENELANFTLGKLYFEAGQHEKSETTLRKTLEINPRHSQSTRLLGQLLIETDRQEEAVGLLEQGIYTAHQKGEFMPRNQMQDLLRSIGMTPPDPAAEGREVGRSESGDWICARCGKSLPQLEKAPLPGERGKQIANLICQSCWKEWMDMSVKVINEYRLNLATEDGNRIWESHMVEFLGLPAVEEG